jgi:hypothetical protein
VDELSTESKSHEFLPPRVHAAGAAAADVAGALRAVLTALVRAIP